MSSVGFCNRLQTENLSRRVSKQPSQRELKLSRVLGAGDYSEVRGSKNTTGEIEIRMIERIECIAAELYGLVLTYVPAFLQGQIQICQIRPGHDIAPGVSEREWRGKGEG